MGSFGACVYTWLLIGLSIAIARENGLVWSEVRERPALGKALPTIAPVYNRGPYAPAAGEEAVP